MKRGTLTIAAIASILTLASAATAQRKSLEVGSEAPEIDVEKWFGDEVEIEQGQIYVVEFWATWCGPCVASIPHLNDLQKEYEADGVHVVGVSNEEPETIGSFVDAQGKRLGYPVAADRRGATQKAWMKAAGLNGIPAVFIVDRERRIAYIGSPYDPNFDTILELVVSGRYDPEAMEEAWPLMQAAKRARDVRDFRTAMRRLNEVIELNHKVFYTLSIEQFKILIVEIADRDRAMGFVKEDYLERHGEDARALFELAEYIATDPDISDENRDLDTALELAEKAVDLANDRTKPEALTVAAAVHHARGELGQAVELQREAYFIARPNEKAQFRQQLDSYRKSQRREASRR